MAQLSDLPAEVILNVLQCVLPDDLESFAKTSTTLFNLAAPLLRQHFELKKKHSTISNVGKTIREYNQPNEIPGNMLATTLKMVLEEPRLAFYVLELRLDSWYTEWEDVSGSAGSLFQTNLHLPYSHEEEASMKKAIANIVNPADVSVWAQQLEKGDETPIIGLLSLLLPNLTTVALEKNYVECLVECLKLLETRRPNQMEPAGPLFPTLTHVKLQPQAPDKEALQFLIHFAAYPSVKSMHAHLLDGRDISMDITALSTRSSNVSELIFEGIQSPFASFTILALTCRTSFSRSSYVTHSFAFNSAAVGGLCSTIYDRYLSALLLSEFSLYFQRTYFLRSSCVNHALLSPLDTAPASGLISTA